MDCDSLLSNLTSVRKTCDCDTELRIELDVLRNYVEQLEELNSDLIKTVVELQKEVEERVSQMENRMQSSAKSTMEAVINLHEWEREMHRLINDRQGMESLHLDLQCEISSLKAENNFLKDQNNNYVHDIHALLHLIQNARSTGCWEMDHVMFCEVTPEQVFGPVVSLDILNVSSSEPSQFPILEHVDEQNCTRCFPVEEYAPHQLALQVYKTNMKHGYSVPEISSPFITLNSSWLPKSSSLSLKKRDLTSVDLLHSRQKAMVKNMIITPSYEVSHGFCNDSDLYRTYSEPYLFVFDDKIFLYKPCESTNHEITVKEMDKLNYRAYQSADQKLSDQSSKDNSFCDHKSPNSWFLHFNMRSEPERSTSVEKILDCTYTEHLEKNPQSTRLNFPCSEENQVFAQAVLIKELQSHVNTLLIKLQGKEEEIVELKHQEKVLQDQKRLLLMQLDAQDDKLECKSNQLKDTKFQLEHSVLQIEQQITIIKSLQDALVESKRAVSDKKLVVMTYSSHESGKRSTKNQSIQSTQSTVLNL